MFRNFSFQVIHFCDVLQRHQSVTDWKFIFNSPTDSTRSTALEQGLPNFSKNLSKKNSSHHSPRHMNITETKVHEVTVNYFYMDCIQVVLLSHFFKILAESIKLISQLTKDHSSQLKKQCSREILAHVCQKPCTKMFPVASS